jgi:flagellar assembly protein FliH
MSSSRIAGRAEDLALEALQWRSLGPAASPAPARKASTPATPGSPPSNAPPPPDPRVAELERTLAAERQAMEQRLQTARQEGFNEGVKQGIQQGIPQGEQRAAAQLDPLITRMARTVEDLASTRDAFRREAEEDLVRLSLGVARRILNRELSIDPDALLGIVRVALGKFDARELHRVRVAPPDEARLRAGLERLKPGRKIEIIADAGLERGALLFETVKGTLDASVETQLEEIERGFLDLLGKRNG